MQTRTLRFLTQRFAILSVSVFVLMCLRTRNGVWVGDFWEHSAVVRELSTHLLHPQHPQLLLNVPHAFYSPYSVATALLSRALRLDVITTLSIVGLVNLGILLLGIRLFVFSLMPQHPTATAFYTLLLVLFFWGNYPWHYSGFFHIGALGSVLPYPSTFAAGLSLIALSVNLQRINLKRSILLVPIFLLAVIILISHPLSFLFLAVGLLSFSFDARDSLLSDMLLIAALLVASLLCVALWPYFPMLQFLMGESDVYHASNRVMYQAVLSRTWPSLLAIPWVISRMRSNLRCPLVLMLAILSGLYLYGALSGKYSFGRVISYIILLLHFTIAERFSLFESRLCVPHVPRWCQRLLFSTSVVICCLVLSWQAFEKTLRQSLPGQRSTDASLLFLAKFTGQYDVVLSDLQTSWLIPTFGGKVVAARNPLAFVPDQKVRRSDLEHFFRRESTLGERQRIIEKYGAKYLLLRKETSADWQELRRSCLLLGQVDYEDEAFLLISLNLTQETLGSAGREAVKSSQE